MTATVETLGEFICPICGNKYLSSGEICPHRVLEILNAQAAEIERLNNIIETAKGYCLDGEYAEAEKWLVRLKEIKDSLHWHTYSSANHPVYPKSRAAREKDGEG